MRLKDVRAAWNAALVEAGLTRRGGTLRLPIDDEWVGWVGLSDRNGGDRMHLFPMMGVQWVPLETWNARLRGEKFRAQTGPTMVMALSRLVDPPTHGWYVTEPMEETLPVVVDEVLGTGLDFIRSIANPRSAVEGLEPPGRLVVVPEAAEERYPLALWLTGRQEEAVAWLRERIEFRRGKVGLFSHYFVDYGERLLTEMQDLLGASASN